MPTEYNRSVLDGSERTPLYNAHSTGSVSDEERYEVTGRVRRKAPLKGMTAGGPHTDEFPKKRRYLSHEAYTAEHGADPADLAKVESFAREHHLTVVESS